MVKKTFHILPKWKGEPIKDTYGNKPVLDWKGKEIRFVELKRKDKDRFQPSQRAFFERAMQGGHRLDNFEIYEWDIEDYG